MFRFNRKIFIYGLITLAVFALVVDRYGQMITTKQLYKIPGFLASTDQTRKLLLETKESTNETIVQFDNSTELIEPPDCFCTSEKSGHKYDFCYKNPKNDTLIGKKFNCTFLSTIEDLGIIGGSLELINLENSERNPKDVIFVTGISKNHLKNFQDSYYLTHKHWPTQKMIVYSLDLDDIAIKNLEKDKNLIVLKFNYTKYPNYVKSLKEYRFKAIILAEVIRDYPHVWWIDAHTRWKNPKSLPGFYSEIADCYKNEKCQKVLYVHHKKNIPRGRRLGLVWTAIRKSSIQMFINSTHSNFAVLHEGLLDYFPTFSLDDLKTNSRGLQLGANFIYLARTEFTLRILKWHTLCALEERCMNPLGSTLNCIGFPRFETYAHCFRYDQSSLNLLMFNEFRDHNSYFMKVGDISRTYNHN